MRFAESVYRNRMAEDSHVRPSADHDVLIGRLEKIEEQVSLLKADLQATASGSALSRARVTSEKNNPNHTSTQPASKSRGRYYVEDSTGATIYLGSRSDAPPVLGCHQPADKKKKKKNLKMNHPISNLSALDT